jgi:hypothetical protein
MTGVIELGRPWAALVTGRIFERLTGRTLQPARITLELQRGLQRRALPVRAGHKSEGWFSLSLPGTDDLPEPPAIEVLRLQLSVVLADGRSRTVDLALTGADLARVRHDIQLGDRTLTTTGLAGSPFRIDCPFDPRPVALQGVVLADADPNSPVEGATVRTGALTTLTDRNGGFRLGPLPLSDRVELSVEHDGTTTDFAHRLDYSQPLNRTELSISS